MYRIIWILTLMLLLSPVDAFSQLGLDRDRHRLGFRIGRTSNPDQYHAGVHLKSLELAPYIRAQPNFEIGFETGVNIVSFNPEIIYTFEPGGKLYHPYLGSGITLASINKPNIRQTEFGMGVSILGGVEFPWKSGRSFLTELKFGLGDIPGLKLSIGMTL